MNGEASVSMLMPPWGLTENETQKVNSLEPSIAGIIHGERKLARRFHWTAADGIDGRMICLTILGYQYPILTLKADAFTRMNESELLAAVRDATG